MMMKISVALCTYNGEKYIKKQLESILCQSIGVTEIIIMDDCSSDATIRIIQEIDQLHPGIIKLFRNEHNIGFLKNFEKALIECCGDYIFISDQDDIWYNDKVERVVSYLDKSGMWGVFTNGELIDCNDKKLGRTLFESLNVKKYLSQKVLYPDLFTMLSLNSNFVTGATLALSKEAKQVVLPFWTSKNIYHDHFISLKLAAIGKFSCLNDCLISYRIHPSQQIGMGKEGQIGKSIYDYYQEAKSSDEKLMIDFCKFLVFRRLWSCELANVCKLDDDERKLQKERYEQLLFPIMKRMRFKGKCEIAMRYLYTECIVKSGKFGAVFNFYGKFRKR